MSCLPILSSLARLAEVGSIAFVGLRGALLASLLSGCASAVPATTDVSQALSASSEATMDIDGMWDFGDPAASEASFRAALARAATDDTGHRLELETQIARALGLQDAFTEAHALLDGVRPRLQGNAAAHVRYLLERGRVFNSAKQVEQARPLFQQAWELGQRERVDRLAVDAAHMLAIVEIGDPDLALSWNLETLRHAEGSQQADAREWLGSLYNNIGWTHLDRGEHDNALEVFDKGLAWRQSRDDPRAALIAKWSVGRALRALGRCQDALQTQRQVEHAYAQNDLGESGFVYEELAECMRVLEQPGHKAYFGRAHALLSNESWLVESDPDRIKRLWKLSGQGEGE